MRVEAAHRHKLGHKWVCFECSSRFYDLNKADPLCPRCGVDQRTAPPVEVEKPKRAKKKKKKKAAAASELEKSPDAAAAEASAEDMGLKVESETDGLDAALDEEVDEELDLEMGDEPGELQDDEVATG